MKSFKGEKSFNASFQVITSKREEKRKEKKVSYVVKWLTIQNAIQLNLLWKQGFFEGLYLCFCHGANSWVRCCSFLRAAHFWMFQLKFPCRNHFGTFHGKLSNLKILQLTQLVDNPNLFLLQTNPQVFFVFSCC